MSAAINHRGCSRDSIEDIWGPRTPYKHEWPVRVDENVVEEPEKWVQSACVLCSNGCGLDIGVKAGKVVAVRGRAVDRVNKGRLGPKGLNGWTAIDHKDRLRYPMVRRDGKLERASWDEAMNLIVEKSKDVIKRLTAHGIGFYTTGQFFLEEYYVLALVGKAGLNTLHMDGNTRLCTATAAASMRESFGCDGQPGSYSDIDYTDCIMMVGHNMAATQTVLWSRVLDRLDGPSPPELIVIDPRMSQTARRASIHLMPRIGTNLALLNGIQHLLFKENYVNHDWVQNHVCNLDELREKTNGYTPEKTSEITGVPVEQIQKVAEVLGQTPSLLSTVLQGVYQSNQATASACQVNNIHLLLGHIGKAGSGVLQMNGQPTAQNNREAGCDGEYPGFRNYNNPNHMKELAELWNIPLERLPHWNQPRTHIENMLNFMANETIEMLWVSGTNPLVSLPNLPRTRKLLTKPNLFVVVQDIFLTETAAIADVVLPAAQWGEKTGCFTNVDRTVHISHKAVEPPGECKSDLEIFLDYGKRMDFRDKDDKPLMNFESSEDVFEAWKRVSSGRPCDYSGLTYEKLTGGSGIQWPCNEKYPYGKERLFDDGKFFTDTEYCESFGHDLETGAPYTKEQYKELNPNGRAILKPCDYKPPLEETNEKYPLQLSTGRNVYQFHTRTKTARSKPLLDACPEPYIELNKQDALKYGIKDGEDVVVRSRRGAVQLRSKISRIPQGRVFIPFHFGYFDATEGKARAANELTTEHWDPVSKQPMFKGGAVSLERVQNNNIQIPEPQTGAVNAACANKPDAKDIGDQSQRRRHLELWLGATLENIESLIPIYTKLIPRLVHDSEVTAGLNIMQRITQESIDLLKPICEQYQSSNEYGTAVTRQLASSLFPHVDGEQTNAYEALTTLTCLQIFYASILSHLTALVPVSQALWDKKFHSAVTQVSINVQRMESWVKHQITVKAPQTLIVPSKVLWEDMEIPKVSGGPSDAKTLLD